MLKRKQDSGMKGNVLKEWFGSDKVQQTEVSEHDLKTAFQSFTLTFL